MAENGEPAKALVFVEPAELGWIGAVRQGPSGAFVKWLSDGVVALDGSPYSHVVIRNGDEIYDARLRGGVVPTPYAGLVRTGRALGFVVHQGRGEDAIEEAWAALGARYEPAPGIADRPIALEPPDFSMLGLLRIGLLLLLGSEGWGGRVGAWLVARRKDDPGYFCSELVAKALVETGSELIVRVPASRITRLQNLPRATLVDLLVSRQDRLAEAATPMSRADHEYQLELLFNLPIAGVEYVDIPVGYPGDEATYPPALVTPRDLFASPSLAFVAPVAPPGLRPGDWARRRREWFAVTAAVAWSAVAVLRRVTRAMRNRAG